MRRSDWVRRINKFFEESRYLLVAAEIEEVKIDQFVKDLASKSDDEIIDYSERLTEFNATDEFKELRRFRSQQPEKWWDHMKAMYHDPNLREFKALADKSKPVRRLWRQLHSRKPAQPTETST